MLFTLVIRLYVDDEAHHNDRSEVKFTCRYSTSRLAMHGLLVWMVNYINNGGMCNSDAAANNTLTPYLNVNTKKIALRRLMKDVVQGNVNINRVLEVIREQRFRGENVWWKMGWNITPDELITNQQEIDDQIEDV
jgi:hypothetical protein